MAVLVLAGVSAIDLGVPVQVFGAESNSVGQVPGTATTAGGWPYSVTVCGSNPERSPEPTDSPSPSTTGSRRSPRPTRFSSPGPPRRSQGRPRPLSSADSSPPSSGARGSRALSTGTFVLARTGLLDGRRATTHWSTAQALARRYPTIDVDENVLFIDEGRRVTSAGAASAIDLCLHLIRRDHGVGLSNQVARRLVAATYRSAGQAQYVPRGVPEPLGDVFADTRQWAPQDIGEELTLGQLAANAGVSVRTFSRRFVEDTGYTPMQWVLRARVDLAREPLENTDLGIEQIADQVGLGTGANLRMHFQRILSISPNEYRHTFSG